MRVEDLGLVGNCQYAALVHRDGRVVWCCLPRFDAPPVFGALLDPNGGSFQVTVLRLKEEAGACVEETPYISAALLDDTVEIYGLAPQANTLPGASVSLVSLSTPVDKSYNADGTADGFTVYLRHKYDDNATRYRIVGMPLSPAPLVFQDW